MKSYEEGCNKKNRQCKRCTREDWSGLDM